MEASNSAPVKSSSEVSFHFFSDFSSGIRNGLRVDPLSGKNLGLKVILLIDKLIGVTKTARVVCDERAT
jgi:hypothetical protein